MDGSRSKLVGFACALAIALPVLAMQAAGASAASFTPLALQNGWTNAPFGTRPAGAALISGVVTFEGAIATSGNNPVPFTLPTGLRPNKDVYVQVDLCDVTNGRLYIAHSTGVVTVQAEGGTFSNAQCVTSLDGVSYGLNGTGYSKLTLQNGWTNAAFSTRNAGVKTINGIAHLEGAIATTGTDPTAFTLPAQFRPPKDVYVPVDLCNAANGRLEITPSGLVSVQAQTSFSDAQCFTSLDGVTYAVGGTFAALSLQNGWTNAPFSTRKAAVRAIGGVVHLKGAITTTGTSAVPFTLPPGFRPAENVYIPVDLCSATNGRLDIDPSGTVTVEAEGGTFSNAQCFTSLEGASFAQ